MGGEAFEEFVECFAAEAPIKRDCCAVVTALEGQESFHKLGEVLEVLGFDDFALHDGEEDLDLVQPGCVDGQVDEFRVGQVSCMRSMERTPLCDEPLSTTQKTLLPEP